MGDLQNVPTKCPHNYNTVPTSMAVPVSHTQIPLMRKMCRDASIFDTSNFWENILLCMTEPLKMQLVKFKIIHFSFMAASTTVHLITRRQRLQ